MTNKEEIAQRAHEELRPELPPGVKLFRTLEGHQDAVQSVAFDPFRLVGSWSAGTCSRLLPAGRFSWRFLSRAPGIGALSSPATRRERLSPHRERPVGPRERH